MTKSYPSELKLIIACSELIEPNWQKITNIVNQEISWPLVLKLTMHHRMLPLIYTRLKEVFKTSLVSEEIQTKFQQCFEYHNKFALILTAKLIKLLKEFSQKEVLALPLKGPVLAQQLHNNITKRSSTDLDILIDVKDFSTVQDILLREGYKMVCPNFAFTPKRFAIFQKWGHHARYIHGQQGICIEIHWRTFTFPVEFPINMPEILKHSQPISLAGSSIEVLPLEEMVLYLCCHGANHAWDRLSWLCDIAKILEIQEVNWSKILNLAEDWQLFYFVMPGIVVASEIFNKQLPQEIKESIDEKTIVMAKKIHNILAISLPDNNYPFTNYYIQKKYYDWSLRRNLRERWQYFLYHIHAPQDWFSSSFPDFLYPLAPLFTPFLWIKRNLNILTKSATSEKST